VQVLDLKEKDFGWQLHMLELNRNYQAGMQELPSFAFFNSAAIRYSSDQIIIFGKAQQGLHASVTLYNTQDDTCRYLKLESNFRGLRHRGNQEENKGFEL